jgi:hypothetical protein
MENHGWWSASTANTNPTNDNYIARVGSIRPYFTFDLSGLTGQVITAIELRLRRYDQTSNVTLSFFDVGTTATALAQRGGTSSAIYNDLGTGTAYGSFRVVDGASTDVLSFVLNPDAVADANAAIGGYFSIGGVATGAAAANYIFGFSNGAGSVQDLVVTTLDPPLPAPAPVPLPAGGWLVLSGAGALALMRRRRRA